MTGIFDNRHNQPAAGLIDLHVLKQAGGIKRLQRGVDPRRIQPFTAGAPEIRADRIGFDPPVAFDDDIGNRLRQRDHRPTDGVDERTQ